MRTIVAGLVLSVLVIGQAVPARATTQAGEAGLALAAAGLDLIYIPAKAVTAALGCAVGGIVGLLTGGDVRSAYALWVPMASGTFIVTPAHLDGERPLEFFGSDYADRPSHNSIESDGSTIYEAGYSSM